MLMFSSSNSYEKLLGVELPGAFEIVAVCNADEEVELDSGRGGWGVFLIELVVEEDRKCWRDRWGVGWG